MDSITSVNASTSWNQSAWKLSLTAQLPKWYKNTRSNLDLLARLQFGKSINPSMMQARIVIVWPHKIKSASSASIGSINTRGNAFPSLTIAVTTTEKQASAWSVTLGTVLEMVNASTSMLAATKLTLKEIAWNVKMDTHSWKTGAKESLRFLQEVELSWVRDPIKNSLIHYADLTNPGENAANA